MIRNFLLLDLHGMYVFRPIILEKYAEFIDEAFCYFAPCAYDYCNLLTLW